MVRPLALVLAALGLLLPDPGAAAPCHGRCDHGPAAADGPGQEPGQGPAQEPALDRSAARCGRCHTDVHGEWAASAHGRAHTDTRYQQALKSRREPQRCLPCHAPASVLDRLGQLPRVRATAHEEGVHCAACHLRGDVVHGPRGPATEAHATHKDPVFQRPASVALCRGCHDLRIADVLPLAREYARSSHANDGQGCVGCHMPAVDRAAMTHADGGIAAPERRGRSHRLLGPDDEAFCGSAFAFRLASRQGGLRLFVANTAGHGIPGLARHRTFAVRLLLQGRDRRVLHEEALLFSGSNRLLVDEERQIDLPRPEGVVALQVLVDHHFAGRRIATVLDQTLDLP